MVAPSHTKRIATRVRVSKSGQITLPAKVREQLGVKIGEQVDIVQETDGTVNVRPVRILSVDEIAGKFGRKVDPDELQDALQEARRFGMVRKRYRGAADNDLD